MTTKEDIIWISRPSFLVYSLPFLVGLLLLLGAFFFMIPLFRFGWWGRGIFLFLVILALVYELNILIRRSNNKLILSQNQVIISRQIKGFSRQIIKIDHEKISQINVLFPGFFSTIFRLGTIEIVLPGENKPIYFSGLRGPEKIQELILRHQADQRIDTERFIKNLTQSQLIELVHSLRRKLGREIFKKITEEGEE